MRDINAQYKSLENWCRTKLMKQYHNRHLEDIVQYVAMRVIENCTDFDKWGLQGRWDWYFCDYCRENGLGSNKRGKHSARTIEQSTFVGEDTWKLETATEDNKDSFLGRMDDFLLQLNLTKGAYKWAMKIQERLLFKAKTR